LAYRGRGPRFVPPPEETHRINRKIRTPQVRLIGVAGEPIGIVPIEEALRLADEAVLDLVEIAPTAQPPVCRILDYGKFKYQQHKKESEAKKKATVTQVKELRLGYRTDHGDIDRQITKAREFLEAGDRVKFLLRFRGREMAYQHLGREKLMGVCDALKDVATSEGDPRMEGRMMGIVLQPGKRKAPSKPVAATAAPAAKAAVETAPAAAPAPKVEAGPEA
jgi:translation initiation factor IF-3